MTYSDNRRDDANQGQQDDFFDQDLAIAGHHLHGTTSQDKQKVEDYANQGQQDDFLIRTWLRAIGHNEFQQ